MSKAAYERGCFIKSFDCQEEQGIGLEASGVRHNMAGDDFCLVTVLEASSSAYSQIALLQPPSLLPCVFSSSVHPFSVGASGFPSTDLLSHFPQGPSPTTPLQDFCAKAHLACNSSLPPTLCSHCIFLAAYWMLPVGNPTGSSRIQSTTLSINLLFLPD